MSPASRLKGVGHLPALLQLFLVLSAALATGCATMPPAQEMSDARQAIHAAREAQAEQHAPRLLERAQLYLDKAAQDLEVGEYERARRNATAAKNTAVEARDRALTAAGQ